MKGEDGEVHAFLADVEPRAYRMTLFALRDPDQAQDVVQDSMLRLVQHYAGRPAGEWPALFFRILHNRIRDVYRRRRTEAARATPMVIVDAEGAERWLDPPSEAAADDPEAASDARTLRAALDRALQRLPWSQRQVFLLREWQGLSVRETAQVLDCSEAAVKQHHFRALRALRKLLAEVWSHV
ncbi:MAG: RNA polymerase sigma factor [Gammaproteobacteria bacterium]|nr:RNA polymerase sigma factor [Gammaproteobacteria bacterium]